MMGCLGMRVYFIKEYWEVMGRVIGWIWEFGLLECRVCGIIKIIVYVENC